LVSKTQNFIFSRTFWPGIPSDIAQEFHMYWGRDTPTCRVLNVNSGSAYVCLVAYCEAFPSSSEFYFISSVVTAGQKIAKPLCVYSFSVINMFAILPAT
jgi:hypothetical protein